MPLGPKGTCREETVVFFPLLVGEVRGGVFQNVLGVLLLELR